MHDNITFDTLKLILFANVHMVVIIIVFTHKLSELAREVNVLQALINSKIEELKRASRKNPGLSRLNHHTRTALQLLLVQATPFHFLFLGKIFH